MQWGAASADWFLAVYPLFRSSTQSMASLTGAAEAATKTMYPHRVSALASTAKIMVGSGAPKALTDADYSSKVDLLKSHAPDIDTLFGSPGWFPGEAAPSGTFAI
jgi:hypothetical protein